MDTGRAARDFFRIVIQWAWFLIAGASIAGTATFVINSLQPSIYRASTKLLIDETAGSTPGTVYEGILSSERRARTYSELLTAEPLLQSVISTLQLPTDVEHLSRSISFQASRDSQVVQIWIEDTDPQRAVSTTNTLVTLFPEQIRQLQSARFQEATAMYTTEIATLEPEIRDTNLALDELGDEAATTNARRDLELSLEQDRQRLTNLVDAFEQLRLSQIQSRSLIVQIEPATIPTNPVAPRIVRNTAVMSIVGLLLALGIVLVRKLVDDTVNDPDVLTEQIELPVIGLIAQMKHGDNSGPIVVTQPRSQVSEAFRSLRTNLRYLKLTSQSRAFL